MATLRIVVRGHVQGVGFRNFVQTLANQYAINGEVWNRYDGAVELIASHGNQEILEAFVEDLHDGPGRVREVTSNEEFGPVETGFRVGSSR
jgi:acylphosphatase